MQQPQTWETISPIAHQRFSCAGVRSVEVYLTSTDTFQTVNYPRAVFVGRKSVTVQGRTPAETVRLYGDSGIVSFRNDNGKVRSFK